MMNESLAVTIKMLASNNDTVEINAQMTCNISCDAYKPTAYCANFDRGCATCHSHGHCNCGRRTSRRVLPAHGDDALQARL